MFELYSQSQNHPLYQVHDEKTAQILRFHPNTHFFINVHSFFCIIVQRVKMRWFLKKIHCMPYYLL